MSYIKMDGYRAEQQSQGRISIVGLSLTIPLGNGTDVEFLAPFVPIGNGLAVAPAVEPDGDTALRIDLARWYPVRIGLGLVARSPMNFSDQAIAVKACRAFDADPNTAWDDPASKVADWLRIWAPENGMGDAISTL